MQVFVLIIQLVEGGHADSKPGNNFLLQKHCRNLVENDGLLLYNTSHNHG